MPDLTTPIDLQRELTKRQVNMGGVFGLQQFGAPPPGRYETYRRMRQNPTIALARAVARAPVSSADHSYECDDGVPEEHVEFVRKQLDPQWRGYVKSALNAWDYGWQSFENVWGRDDQGRTTLDWIKPLTPDGTTIELADDSDRVIGVTQGGVKLRGERYILVTNEAEAGNPYGVSRMECIRESAWHPWVETAKRMNQYMVKVAGVVLLIEYPVGQSPTASGVKDNAELAQQIGDNLTSGKPVGVPRVMDPQFEDQIRNATGDMSQFRAWQFRFLESTGDHSQGFIGAMSKYETLMVRGWLLPERSVLEGQYGTKAEAGVHGDVAVQVSEDFTVDFEDQANAQIVDTLTMQNFGYKGKIRVRIAKLIDEEQAASQALFDKVIANPTFGDQVISSLDLDALIDELGYPRVKQTRDLIEGVRGEARDAIVTGDVDPLAMRNGAVVG